MAILEAIVIIILLFVVAALRSPYPSNETSPTQTSTSASTSTSTSSPANINYPLLSTTINSGYLAPQSFLIFNFGSLRDYLTQVVYSNNLDVSLYALNLRDGSSFQINGDTGAYPASLNKIPVAVLVLNEIEKGQLSFDTPVSIDKSLFSNDTDPIYYQNSQLSVRTLLERMLQQSDNTAFKFLLAETNVTDLNKLMDYYDIDAQHSYKYTSEADMESNALLTPSSFSNMFSSLYYSTILNANDSEYVLELLSNTTVSMNQLANVPNNVTIAHKWGYYSADNTSIFNDCGIMYIGNGRILYCASIRNQSIPASNGVIGGIVNSIYQFFIGQSRTNSQFKQYLINSQ